MKIAGMKGMQRMERTSVFLLQDVSVSGDVDDIVIQ
jgi:hypothetical protein